MFKPVSKPLTKKEAKRAIGYIKRIVAISEDIALQGTLLQCKIERGEVIKPSAANPMFGRHSKMMDKLLDLYDLL